MAPDNNEVRIDTMFRQSEKIRRKAATGVRWHQGVVLLTMLLLVQVVAACSLYTTSPIQPVASGGQSDQFDKQFDPNSYADKNWSSKVVPTIVDKSVDIGTVLKALEQNSDAAQKQYAEYPVASIGGTQKATDHSRPGRPGAAWHGHSR
jgi:predicted lipoprotein